jgi:hypothetical protein
MLSLALAGCNRQGEGNPDAPGRPVTGNSPEVAAPSAPDTPPGGPSGVKGSMPHPGSSGGDAAPGTSGSGTSDASGRNPASQPGAGLGGGMGGSSGLGMTGTFPAGTTTQSASTRSDGEGVAAGSTNRTPRSGVGTR